MLSQLRTAVVPPPSPSSHPFTRHPRQPQPHSVFRPLPSPLASAPIPQAPHLNGHSNGALSNWTSINQEAYSALPDSGAMAGGPPWTDAEKIQLLVEILKDCEVVAPNWRNIQIPPGRTSLQAQQVFALLTTSPESSPVPSPVAAAAPEPLQTPPVVPLPAQPPSSSSRKRLHPEPFNPKMPGGPPTGKRKRGRPSKADIALRDSQAGVAVFQPRMYTPGGQGRGGGGGGGGGGGIVGSGSGAAAGSLLAAIPGGSHGQAGLLHQQLADLPPPRKKRGRPSKAEIEARRERARLEALHLVHGMHGVGDLPPAADPEQQQQQHLHQQPPRQKDVHDPRQEHEPEHEPEHEHEHEPEQGQGPEDDDDDNDSDEDAVDSPNDEE